MEVLASMTMPTRRGRLICWRKEVIFSGRLLVVEQREVALLEIGNVVAVLVSDGEDQVDFVDAESEGRADVLVLLRRAAGCWPARRLVRPEFARAAGLQGSVRVASAGVCARLLRLQRR